MGLTINTNIAAMIAMRHLNENEIRGQIVMTRLATGLRINSAADDPAGLIISEGLRAHIQGLDQAVRNTQDAVNMVKTAESALNEVSRLLRGIRSIAVHSANTAVVDSMQLTANQSQIRSVLLSIDRIADHTSWGTKKLLNGSAGVTAGITRTDLVSSLYIGSEFNNERVRSGEITMTQVTQATRTTTGAMATQFTNSSTVVQTGTFVLNGVTFLVESGQTLADVAAKINQKSGQTGVLASIIPNGANVSMQLTSIKFGSNFPINYMETTGILNGGVAATPAVGIDAVYDVEVPIEPNGTTTERFTGGQGPGVDGLTLTSTSGNKLVISAAGNSETATTIIGALSVGTMKFQIGALADQSTSFSIPSSYTIDIGKGAVSGMSLADVDVTTAQGAEDAIRIIDAAVQQIAFLRGEMGSFQMNFLESTARSLQVAHENMTASESIIRDADIAKEMTEFTKIQILRQSGMAVLAQANQSAQSVLQLLGRQ